jgi:hypothetical protein
LPIVFRLERMFLLSNLTFGKAKRFLFLYTSRGLISPTISSMILFGRVVPMFRSFTILLSS